MDWEGWGRIPEDRGWEGRGGETSRHCDINGRKNRGNTNCG